MKKQLEFSLSRKDTLNSNVVIAHYSIKSKLAGNLRKIAAEAGIKEHPNEELSQKKFEYITAFAAKTLAKSRARKLMGKKGSTATEEEILEKLEEIELSTVLPEIVEVPYMFKQFKLRLTVCPPTKRKVDPPNFYPTLKALVDGLTDASWWEDDEFSQLLEVSFRYGGLSGEKDVYKFILDIEEVDNVDEYVTTPVIVERGDNNG